MKVKALVPLNHNDKTVAVDEIIELEDEAAKTLISIEAVEEVKDTVAPLVGVNTKNLINDKQSGGKEND